MLANNKKNKIFLISDSFPLKNGMGISQTIYNLFEDYPPENLILYTPLWLGYDKDQALKCNKLFFKRDFLRPLRNRFAFIFNPFIKYLNKYILKNIYSLPMTKAKAFKPDLLFVLPNAEESIIVASKMMKSFNLPVVTYFMDDWMGQSNANLHSSIRNLLKKSIGWLLISTQLKEIIQNRYKIEPRLFHISHNPVRISASDSEVLEIKKTIQNDELTIAYAGSIWGMHLDALMAVSKAVSYLRKRNYSVRLIIYTSQNFFDMYKDLWQQDGIIYGGHKNYPEILNFLKKADLLLLVSSFLPEYENHSKSSLQTKVTDYMTCNKPILGVGPNYSICNEFIQTWNLGKVIYTNKTDVLAKEILIFKQDYPKFEEIGKNGLRVLQKNFEHNSVCNQMYDFLTKVQSFK